MRHASLQRTADCYKLQDIAGELEESTAKVPLLHLLSHRCYTVGTSTSLFLSRILTEASLLQSGGRPADEEHRAGGARDAAGGGGGSRQGPQR